MLSTDYISEKSRLEFFEKGGSSQVMVSISRVHPAYISFFMLMLHQLHIERGLSQGVLSCLKLKFSKTGEFQARYVYCDELFWRLKAPVHVMNAMRSRDLHSES